MEGAARRQGAGTRWLAAHDRPLPQAIGGIRLRHRREQGACVRVARVLDERPCRRHLDHPSGIHHRDPVGGVARAREVVGDGQHGQAASRAQVAQQGQDLGPAGRVDHGHRLVRDEELGFGDQGPRDVHALPLTARQRVRVAADDLRRGRQPDRLQRGDDPTLLLLA